MDSPPITAIDLAEQLLLRASQAGIAPPPDPTIQRHCPLLWGLLTQDTYRDGTVRILPTITINRITGGYLVTLQDHASCQQATCETLCLVNAWVELEKVLSGGGDCFRPYKSFKVKDPLKRKKRNSG